VKATEAYFNVARKLLHENYSAAYRNGHDLHWLRSEEAYKYIYTLHQQGRIVPLKANLLSNAALPTVAEAAKKLGVPIRVFYTSNADDQWPLTDEYRTNVLAFPFDRRAVMIHTTLSETRAKKRHDWDYIIHDGRDIQRRFRAAGWTQMRWLNGEGHRVQPNLVTIGLPGRTTLDEPAKPSGG
jgi:hypothetical protein